MLFSLQSCSHLSRVHQTIVLVFALPMWLTLSPRTGTCSSCDVWTNANDERMYLFEKVCLFFPTIRTCDHKIFWQSINVPKRFGAWYDFLIVLEVTASRIIKCNDIFEQAIAIFENGNIFERICIQKRTVDTRLSCLQLGTQQHTLSKLPNAYRSRDNQHW